MGGGNELLLKVSWREFGLSPRGRGKPWDMDPLMLRSRSIPAWAGETAERRDGECNRRVYPRVGGGNINR